MTLTPLNPLPIGFCGAVHLTVLDASGQVPRNSLGARVTMADFDFAVRGASVAGNQIDAYHFDACACQGGTAGADATVTATYPARTLAPEARVRGVAVQRTAGFTLAPPKGSANPRACETAASPAIVAAPSTAVALPPAAPAVTVAPPPVPAPTGVPAAVGPAIGDAVPDPTAARVPPYVPGPVTVNINLSANGSWYDPGPVVVNLALAAQGSWYDPGPVTITIDLSATGTWVGDRTQIPIPPGPIQPALPRP